MREGGHRPVAGGKCQPCYLHRIRGSVESKISSRPPSPFPSECVGAMNCTHCFSVINPLDADILPDSICQCLMPNFHTRLHENYRSTFAVSLRDLFQVLVLRHHWSPQVSCHVLPFSVIWKSLINTRVICSLKVTQSSAVKPSVPSAFYNSGF